MEPLKSILQTVDSALRYTLSPVLPRSASTDSTHFNFRSRASDIWGLRADTSCSMLIRIAGISGATAVALAAYGSHVINEDKVVDDRRKRSLENGNKQHFLHTIGLLLSYKARFPIITAALFTSGIICFSGPCYAYGIWNDSRLRKITPLGGILFILGWLSFVLESKCMPTFDCIERPLSLLFYRHGCYISKHPIPFIIFPVLFTLALSTGFLYLEPITDAIYLFTPKEASSKMERQAIHDLWPLFNGSYIPGRTVTQSREIQLTVRSRDGGNILEKRYSEAIYRLDAYVTNRVKVEHENRTYYFRDLCLSRRTQGCPGNKHVQLISDLYQHGFNLTYPTITFGNVQGYIGSSLGGVSVFHGNNGSMVLASAKAWLMVYHLQFYPPELSYISGLWEKAFEKAMKEYPRDPFIEYTFFHSQTLAEELKRNADSLAPRFVLAFGILIVFSVVCNMSFCDGTWYIDWVISKPILAVFGVINAAMGIASAIGALTLLSCPYNDIVGVMPFLVIAVGIDNMFLMIAAVRRTPRTERVARRIGEAMSDAAISMFITSLTDAFSFGVGCITSIPAVQIFCMYTCVAVMFTFVYQLTFFSGLLALSMRWESENLHCIRLQPTVDEKLAKNSSPYLRWFWMGSQVTEPSYSNSQSASNVLKESGAALFFQNWFGPILMHPTIKFISMVWYCIYMAFAVYGCAQIREGLEPVNLLVEDSYAIPHYRVLEEYFWHYGASLQVVVNNAPNLMDPDERLKLKSMVHAFANTRHTIGDASIQFWLAEMERYFERDHKADMLAVRETFYSLAMHFFNAKNTDFWPDDVKWTKLKNGKLVIKSFRFLIGLRDITTSVEQQDATMLMREVASRYPQYNITTFMPLWLFTDQYAIIVPNTVQNIIIAMVVMVIIALLLIPQPSCALWVTLAIASIDVGVIGYMTLWGVNLDAISMITIIMSIGFSVDYSAHITYGYVISPEPTPTDRIRSALGSLGWPLTQGAASTILAVAVLADVPAYMIVTFFKTVFLAISIGLLHGLVFLPVTLSLCVRSTTNPKNKLAVLGGKMTHNQDNNRMDMRTFGKSSRDTSTATIISTVSSSSASIQTR